MTGTSFRRIFGLSALAALLANPAASRADLTPSTNQIAYFADSKSNGSSNVSGTLTINLSSDNDRNQLERNSGADLAINGSASRQAVLLVLGNTDPFQGSVTRIGGIGSDQFTFLFPNNNILVPGSGSSFRDDAINDNLVESTKANGPFNALNELTIDSRVIGGKSTQFNNRMDLSAPPPSLIPQPASVAMILIGGGMAAGCSAFRRSRAIKAAEPA